MFAKISFMNSNLDDSGICSSSFLSRINMRTHNIPVTRDLVKEVIVDLDSLKVTWPGCIPVAAVKNCEPELLYVLAHCNQGPGKSWKVLEFDKCPGLLINFKKYVRLSWNSYMRKSIFDHLLSFSKYFIMIDFQFVSVIMLVFLSIYLRKIMSKQMLKRKWINKVTRRLHWKIT